MRYVAAWVSLAALGLVACSSDGGSATPMSAAGAAGSTTSTSGAAGAATATAGGANGGAGGATNEPPGGSSSAGANPMTGAWQNATGNLANMVSECGNLGLVAAQPGTDMVIAGVAQKGLWATHDGGKTWTSLGSGAGSAAITNRISAVVWDPDHSGTFWESGIYNAGGVYKTTDNGVTFAQAGDATHNDSVSVDLSDPARLNMLAGSHETAQKLFHSADSGATWTDIGPALPANSGYCTSTLVMNSKTFLVGCSGEASAAGIYRSTDAGASWAEVGTEPVWAQPLVSAAGAIYWPGTQGGVEKSADGGASFKQVVDGNTAAAVVAPTTLAEMPDGRIVAIGKDHLQASADGGTTWAPLGDPLPYTGGGYNGASGVTYSAMTKTFFIWRWTCDNNVPDNAIMSLTLAD
jgi:hypothetical protein